MANQAWTSGNSVDFNGVVKLPLGILGPLDGVLGVDLVTPGCEPILTSLATHSAARFCGAVPWVVIGIAG